MKEVLVEVRIFHFKGEDSVQMPNNEFGACHLCDSVCHYGQKFVNHFELIDSRTKKTSTHVDKRKMSTFTRKTCYFCQNCVNTLLGINFLVSLPISFPFNCSRVTFSQFLISFGCVVTYF